MEIGFIPEEWRNEADLRYVRELLDSMDITPEQREELVRTWAEATGVYIEAKPIEVAG